MAQQKHNPTPIVMYNLSKIIERKTHLISLKSKKSTLFALTSKKIQRC